MNLIRKIVLMMLGRKGIIDLIDVDLLNAKTSESKIKKCDRQVIKGDGSQFYEDAVVYNSFKNKSKIVIGKNSHLRGQLLIFNYGGEIKIGDDCYVGDGSRIWSGESITIGNNVLISHDVGIVDTNAHELDHQERADRYRDLIANGPWESKGSIMTAPIVIKDNAWVSFGATVLKGVTIGEGSIVAAGAVVTKDVPDWTLVAGNPAKAVKSLKETDPEA